MIILLHGYGDSKNIFKPLWRKLVLTNAAVAAINYPSLFRSSLAAAYQLLFFLNHIDDINEVSFVTKGGGNIVLQKALNLPVDQQIFKERMRIANIVEINPVIRENLLCDFLAKFKLCRFILGPMILDFTEKSVKKVPGLPNEFHVLKIFSDSKVKLFALKLLELCHFPIETKKYSKKDSIYVKGVVFNPLKNQKILNSTVKFINNGKI